MRLWSLVGLKNSNIYKKLDINEVVINDSPEDWDNPEFIRLLIEALEEVRELLFTYIEEQESLNEFPGDDCYEALIDLNTDIFNLADLLEDLEEGGLFSPSSI